MEERNHLDLISHHLDKMGVPFELKDIGNETTEIFPALICTYRCKGLNFDVILYNIGEWINVKCMVMDLLPMDDNSKTVIYEIALELNYDLPEVTFSLHNHKLYIEIDCLTNIDFDDFEEEFTSIGDGIDAFMGIIDQKPNITLQSTNGKISTDNGFPREK